MFAYYITIIIFVIYYWCTKTFNYWKRRGIPYVRPTAYFGNILPFVKRKENYYDMLNRIYKSLEGNAYGGYFEMREPILMIRDPNLVNLITIKNFNNFQDRNIDFVFNTENRLLNPLSKNLLSTKGHEWRNLRQKLSPVFSSNKLNSMFEQIKNCVSNLDKLLTEKNGSILEIQQIFTNFEIDIIGSTAFGISFSTVQEYENSEFGKMARKTFFENNYPLKFLLMSINKKLLDFFQLPDFPEDVTQYFISIIKNSIDYRQKTNIERKDILQMLMEVMKKQTNSSLTEYDEINIASNAFLFFTAGFETTASVMSFFIYEIAIHKDVQEKIRNEVEEVKNKNGGHITIQSLKELTYLDMVLSEILRIYPSVPAMFRVCTENYQIPETNTVIEKGTKIIIPIQAVQNDPQYFPNPELFDPERFSPENKFKIPNGCYFPFGEGPHYCIGMRFAQMQMKMALALMVSNYQFTTCEKTEVPLTFLKGVPLKTAQNGIWLHIEKLK